MAREESFGNDGGSLWELLAGILKLVRPDRDSESRTGVPLWGVVVESPTAKRERALRFRRGKRGRPTTRTRE